MTAAQTLPVLNSPQLRKSEQETIDRSWELYYRLRSQIETPENIGRLILLDVDSGDYEIAQDELGFAASASLRHRHPAADPLALRIGYEAVEVLGGVLERIDSE